MSDAEASNPLEWKAKPCRREKSLGGKYATSNGTLSSSHRRGRAAVSLVRSSSISPPKAAKPTFDATEIETDWFLITL